MNLNDKAYIPTIKDMAMAVDAENLSDSGLTLKQEAFCKAYTTYGDTFGNATLSYGKAFGYDLAMADRQRVIETVTDKEGKETQQEVKGTSEYDKMYDYLMVAGPRLRGKDSIQKRIQELMVENFDSDALMDQRLIDIALQGKDTDSIQAIKHRSDIKQRITKKLDVTTAGRPLAGLSDEELLKLAGE